MQRGWLVITLVFIFNFAFAQDLYPFKTPQQQTRFNNLLEELRCLVCQNESLAASDAKLAEDLRQDVYHMVLQDKTNADIKRYLVARYGEFVLFKPPVSARTYVLWFAPFLILVIGFVVLGFTVRNYHHGH